MDFPFYNRSIRSGEEDCVCRKTPFRTIATIGRNISNGIFTRNPNESMTEKRYPSKRNCNFAIGPMVDLSKQLVTSTFQTHGHVPFLPAFGVNALGFLILRKKLLKSLTPQGYVHALILGTGLWATLGWRGWSFCVLYLLLGSVVTKIRFAEKSKLGIAEGRGGRRGPENVWGSAATGLFCAICSVLQPKGILGTISSELFLLGYVASISTKMADTAASEIGKAYGKTTFLITTFERVPPGTEGAVSAEGTVASIGGGLLLSLYGWSIGLISKWMIPVSVTAAFIATNIESILGATLQGKQNLEWITNEVINFMNTLIGAILAITAGLIFL